MDGMAYALAGSASSQIVSALIHGINEWPKSREMPAYENVRDWQILLQSRKSNDPKNLAKGDFQKTVALRSAITLLRRSVAVFPRNDVVSHVATCNTRQRPSKLSFVTPKRRCNKIGTKRTGRPRPGDVGGRCVAP
jgi:hypothetical protein